MNLFCSAFSRFPWKKYQTGFVITHLGIIFILTGSLVTEQWGLDGQIALKEGEQGHIFRQENPNLYYQINDDPPESIPASFPLRAPSADHPLLTRLAGDGLLMVDRFYLNAQKTVKGRPAQDVEKGFPAIHLELNSSFVHQDQWLFLGDKGNDQMDLGPASVYFKKAQDWKKTLAGGAKALPGNALAILTDADGSLKYQTRYHGQFQPVQLLETGKDYATGWMDMQFKASDRLSNALPEEGYDPQPLPRQQDPQPALHYEFLQNQFKKDGWLGYQDSVVSFVFSAGETLSLAYGPEKRDLPFLLHLVKFKVGFDPGTEKPASYASDVFYMDPDKGTEVPVKISMNEPLHYLGYTIYQASYETDPDGKYVSVFSVGKDPGIWLKYSGAIMLVCGIIFMFWFKNPAWNKRESNANI